MHRVVVIGRRDHVLPFRAAGAEVIEAADAAAGRKAVAEVAKREGPGLLILTEDMADACASEVAAYRRAPERAVLVISSPGGAVGRRMEHVRHVVSHALGVDLLGHHARRAAREPSEPANGAASSDDMKGRV